MNGTAEQQQQQQQQDVGNDGSNNHKKRRSVSPRNSSNSAGASGSASANASASASASTTETTATTTTAVAASKKPKVAQDSRDKGKGNASTKVTVTAASPSPYVDMKEDVIRAFVDLPPIPPTNSSSGSGSSSSKSKSKSKQLLQQPLTVAEREELEVILEFDAASGDTWRDDWSGNLAYLDKDIGNPRAACGATNTRSSSSSVVVDAAGGGVLMGGSGRGRGRGRGRGSSKKSKEGAAAAFSTSTSSSLSSSFQQSILQWAHHVPAVMRLAYNIVRLVYHMDSTPSTAKTLLATIDPSSVESMEAVTRRISYDPAVLRQDGWTTARSETKQGATGGPYLIGAKLRWQDGDAVVIAYDHDADIGDLWKCFWIHEEITFDLEAEEVLEGIKKWERRYLGGAATATAGVSSTEATSRRSARYAGSHDFTVDQIQYGIVLAASYAKGARLGVYWPARVMHAAENIYGMSSGGCMGTTSSKRSTAKQKVDVVFLAPYWNSDYSLVRPVASSSSSRIVESLSEAAESRFDSGPLFEVENIDATSEMIKPYSYGTRDGKLDLDELRMAFRFTGLPKQAFGRFLDSHRLAMAFRTYAKQHIQAELTAADLASAGLFDTHIMSLQTPLFPSVVLHLPFEYILYQIRQESSSDANTIFVQHKNEEEVIRLKQIVDAMNPPKCWGTSAAENNQDDTDDTNGQAVGATRSSSQVSPVRASTTTPDRQQRSKATLEEAIHTAEEFNQSGVQQLLQTATKDLPNLVKLLSIQPPLPAVIKFIKTILSQLFAAVIKSFESESTLQDDTERQKMRRGLLRMCLSCKRMGLEALSSLPESKNLQSDWRVAIERMYRHIRMKHSTQSTGDGISAVLSDYRCNGHRTENGCFERAVRLPAAMKGAKLAGAGKSPNISLSTEVSAELMERVEQEILPLAHTRAYLDRIKNRCSASMSDDQILLLTEDSDGNGGEDTRGSRGTWQAAVAAVTTAITAADKIIDGDCVNAFCITRPPGHHAGTTLHPMHACSNGFCILNPVACAALYATLPVAEGGLGLSRVCVIDFDVHHGNGTQQILCEKYDKRFLYVSIHAGGSHVNGITLEDDPNHELHDLNVSKNPKYSGIYPGRCGDTSPHDGVLNLPMGAKVTSHEVGLVLVNKVSPRVNEFAPDLIILSAGFDAHKADPMGLGALSAEDFGHITDVACHLAFKSCSGRVLSILEGGYGIPCCRAQRDDQQPAASTADAENPAPPPPPPPPRPQPSKLLDLDDNLPDDIDDQVPLALQRRLEKCFAEGFVECIREHVSSLARCNKVT